MPSGRMQIPGGSFLTPLSRSDFTSLGAFKPPDPYGFIDFGSGLALRRVSGTAYLYSFDYSGRMIEYTPVADGSLADGGGYSTGTLTGSYGDIFQNALYQAHDDGGSGAPLVGLAGGARPANMFWDDTDSRLYWTRYARYDNTTADSDTCLGYSTLNFGAKTGTGVAMWKLSPPGPTSTDAMTDVGNRWTTGVTAIPTSFANTYLGGRRLGLGFGDPSTSIATNGPISMGPAFFAMNPADLNVAQDRTYYSGSALTKMIFHPYKSTLAAPFAKTRPVDSPCNSHRDDGYDVTSLYQTWTDQSRGGVWIRGTTKEGLLVPMLGSLGTANTTISSAPTPTNTTCALSNLSGIEVGDLCFLETEGTAGVGTYQYSHAQVTGIDTISHVVTVTDVRSANDGSADSSNILSGGFFYTGSRYIGGGPVCSRVTSLWYCYSAASLALSAQGSTLASAVTPYDEGFLDLPGVTFPLHNVQDLKIIGVAYDDVAKRLYLAIQNVPSVGVLICVFSVNC